MRTPRRQRRALWPAAGYSLLEVMIALGILAIALPMLAAAFMAGMVENEDSVENTMALMIAENAIAATRARVSHLDLTTAFGDGQMGSPEQIPLGVLKRKDLDWKPYNHVDGFAATPFSCAVMAQRLTAKGNDYRLVAIPFRRFVDTDTVTSVSVTGLESGPEGNIKLSSAPGKNAAIGSVLVVRCALRPEPAREWPPPAGG